MSVYKKIKILEDLINKKQNLSLEEINALKNKTDNHATMIASHTTDIASRMLETDFDAKLLANNDFHNKLNINDLDDKIDLLGPSTKFKTSLSSKAALADFNTYKNTTVPGLLQSKLDSTDLNSAITSDMFNTKLAANTTFSNLNSTVTGHTTTLANKLDSSTFNTFKTSGDFKLLKDSVATLDSSVGTLSSHLASAGISNFNFSYSSISSNNNFSNLFSDKTLKKDISTIKNGLDIIASFRPVYYNWIDEEKYGSQKEVGFIAQEIEQAAPEIVKEKNGYLAIEYQKAVVYLVAAVKELQQKIIDLENQLKKSEKSI